MSYYYVGDVPIEPLVVLPELNGVPLEIHGQDLIEVMAISPTGEEILTLTAAHVGQVIEVSFPATSIFDQPGIYTIVCILDHSEHDLVTSFQQVDPVRIVADDVSVEWMTLALTREAWVDSRAIEDPILYDLLEIAKHQILEYAPALAEGAAIPLSYKMGQLSQARNIYNGSIVDAGNGDIGNETFSIRPFPLDWQIKQLVRPRRGNPVVG